MSIDRQAPYQESVDELTDELSNMTSVSLVLVHNTALVTEPIIEQLGVRRGPEKIPSWRIGS